MSANGSNRFLNIEDANLRVRSGNVYAKGITVGGITVGAAHGLQSVSDVSNTTSNTLQFTNATTSFKATSNIEVGGDVSYTSKPKISVESNVVAEYTGPHDRPLREYPEVELDVNAMTSPGVAGYIVAHSGQYSDSFAGWTVFGEEFTNTNAEATVGAWLDGSPGSYAKETADAHNGVVGSITTAVQTAGTLKLASNTPVGAWISLELPTSIKLQRIEMRARLQHASETDLNEVALQSFPREFGIWGYDGSSWVLLKSVTGHSANSAFGYTPTHVNATTAYNKYAIVVTRTNAVGGSNSDDRNFTAIGQLYFYGYEEGSGSLDTTLKSVYNVPATTGTQLEVYYDAKDLADGAVSSDVTDLSPNTNNGTVSGDPQISNGAFVFDGTGDYFSSTVTTTTGAGNWPHSYSFWMKADTDTASTAHLVALGTEDVSTSAIRFNNDDIRWYFWGNDVIFKASNLRGRWVHIVGTYDGGAVDTSRKIFINNVEAPISSISGTIGSLNLTTTSTPFKVGSQLSNINTFKGSIANFRLFSKALNAGQVQELYDYQKDYFLGSKSQVTLYKGHLGVGVTEPSGQLELAGDERIQEYPPRAMTKNETLVEGHGVFSALGGTGGETYAPWKAFDKSTSTFWIDGEIRYSDVTPFGALSTASKTTLYDGSVLSGGWIDLECPYPVKLKRVGTAPRTNYSSIGLQRGIILGSNNGVDWYQIDTIDYAGTTPPNTLTYFDITTETYYSHLRLVCTNLTARYPASGTSDMHWQMGELVYFGTPGPTTLDKGSLTLGRSLDVPRVSRYDVDTETPRPEKLVVDFDTTVNSSPTDISGQGNHGTLAGASYSVADKAFSFDASTDKINGNVSGHNTALGAPFTITLWAKVTGNSDVQIGFNPSGTAGTQRAFEYRHSSDFRLAFNGGRREWNLPSNISNGKWFMMTVTHAGSRATSKCYVDGQELTLLQDAAGQDTTALPDNSPFQIESSDADTTSSAPVYISNFKMYDVALEPSEVQKLYRLGRTGRSMVISDTAVGIGKVPEAQLDVRGSIKGINMTTCPVFFDATASATTVQNNNMNFDSVNASFGGGLVGTRFTAPIRGYYYFSIFFMGQYVSAGQLWASFMKNGSEEGLSAENARIYDNRATGDTQRHGQNSGSAIIFLNGTGDYVEILNKGGISIHGQYNRFQGFYLSG